ncbi:hypothetical protein R1sor_011924 [Riccia sorocarpa]|uniref:ATR-interacting protein n=1 Tax=Riccia sorocarpa TaxID=122646 RepID=A0ABD3I2D3_9MARC
MHLTVTFLASGRDFHGTGDHELSNVDDQPGTSGGHLHGSGDHEMTNIDHEPGMGIREDDNVVADGLQEDINNNKGTAEDSGRAGPSRTRPVTDEEVAALERKRDSLWWEVDLLETKKIRFQMEKEELEAAVARNDSELMTAVRKLEGVQGELDNKLQIDGKKRSLHVLTTEVESAKRESAKIPRFSIASCPLNIEESELATNAVDADRYNSLLGETRPANRFDRLLAAVQDVMDSTETPEHSLASLLAAIDNDTEPPDSPSHHGQEETEVDPTDTEHRSKSHPHVGEINIFVDLVLHRYLQKVPILDGLYNRLQQAPERSGAERIPQPPPVEKECVSEDHTIKVTTVDNTPVTANTSGGSPNRRPTSQTRKEKRKADSRLEEEP